MGNRKSTPQELDHGTQRILALADLTAKLGGGAIKWGGLVAIAFFIYKSIASLSGQTTLADGHFVFNILANLGINRWLWKLLTGGSIVWAVGERKLRRRKVAELSAKLKTHELAIDKDRSSSMLPPTGTTRQEDV